MDKKQLKDEFCEYLAERIPQWQMPANKYFNRFNTAIKNYLSKNKNLAIESILDIQDISELNGILSELDSPGKYAYSPHERGNKRQGLEYYIHFLLKRSERAKTPKCRIMPVEEMYVEGGVLDCHGTRYERDPKARKACIEKFGWKCAVCGFDFEAIYGEAGKGFIEVHHLKPLANIKEKHETIPVEDLRPLCSNCHSIAHRRKPDPYTIEEIKQMIKS